MGKGMGERKRLLRWTPWPPLDLVNLNAHQGSTTSKLRLCASADRLETVYLQLCRNSVCEELDAMDGQRMLARILTLVHSVEYDGDGNRARGGG